MLHKYEAWRKAEENGESQSFWTIKGRNKMEQNMAKTLTFISLWWPLWYRPIMMHP